MFSVVLLVVVSLLVAAIVGAIATFGSRKFASTDSAVGHQLAKVSRHLNGEAEVPPALNNLMTRHG